MSQTSNDSLTGTAKLIGSIDEMPALLVCRAAVGYCIPIVFEALFPRQPRGGRFVVVFLGTLLALRIGAGVVRRLLPFPASLKRLWAERRVLAGRYDSFQWRKAAGLGLGLGAQLIVSGNQETVPWVLAVVFMVGGLIAWWRWRGHSHKRPLPQPA